MTLQLNSVILQFLWNNSFAFAVSVFLVVAATVWIVLNFTGSRERQKTVLENSCIRTIDGLGVVRPSEYIRTNIIS